MNGPMSYGPSDIDLGCTCQIEAMNDVPCLVHEMSASYRAKDPRSCTCSITAMADVPCPYHSRIGSAQQREVAK